MLEQLLTNPFLYTLSLTLLHFLWQGLVVAMVLKSALIIIDKSKSRLRYSLSGFAMLANLVIAVCTFLYIFPNNTESFTNNILPIPLTSLVNELTQQNSLITYQELLPSILAYSLPYIALLWLVSITALATKLLIEIRNVNHLPKHAHIVPSPELFIRFQELAKQIKLTKVPKLLISLKIDVPMAIGWLKPVVLLPASMVTGLSPAQLDMLLLHELAHIRRYDYLANFLQTIIELLFFFHPSVAWVGKQIRNEREYCSDDIAVQHCGDPIAYAHTLADTASLCAQGHLHTIPSMAMAASGGDLKERVLRLVDHHCAPSNTTSKWFASISILFAIILIFSNQLINHELINNVLPNQWRTTNQLSQTTELNEIVRDNLIADAPLGDSLLINLPLANLSENDIHINSIAQHLLAPEPITFDEITAPLIVSASRKNIYLDVNQDIDIISLSNNLVNEVSTDKQYTPDTAKLSIEAINPDANSTPAMITLDVVKEKQTLVVNQPNEATVNSVKEREKVEKSQVSLVALVANNTPNVENTLLETTNLHSQNISRQFKDNDSINNTIARAAKTIDVITNKAPNQTKIHPNDFSTTLKDPYQQHLLTLASFNEANHSKVVPDKIQKKMTNEVIWHTAQQLNTVDPVYPSLAKRKGIEIEIQVKFTIDEYGEVRDITFAEQSRVNYFKSAIRSAIRKWRFIPAKKNEQAIESQMSKIFSFSLQA